MIGELAICELDGHPIASHARSVACGVLVGPRHTWHDVDAQGLDQECAEARERLREPVYRARVRSYLGSVAWVPLHLR